MKYPVRVVLSLATCVLFSCGGSKDEGKAAKAPSNSCTSPTSMVEAQEATPPANRFLVKMKARALRSSAASMMRIANTIHGQAEEIAEDLYLIQSPSNESVSALKTELDPSLYEYIEPDFRVHTTLASNDPLITKQWAHKVVESQKAWDINRGGNVIVAVLDTGIDPSHPDLAPNLWTNRAETLNGKDDDGNGYIDDIHGWNFVSNNNQLLADDSSFHGTHVAGTIGAVGNNRIGISGHAQDVKLMSLKFLSGDGGGYISHAIKGIDYAIAHGAKIINNSWGSSSRSQALSEAISRAEAAGVLFVAAAGNYGNNNDRTSFYPANYPQGNVISVAATTSNDRIASFSNFGAMRVHIAAPGSSIYSTKNGNSYQTLSGTSMATPLISGVLATMVAARPDLSYSQIKGALLSSVDPIPSMAETVLWKGRVNAFRALTTAVSLPGNWQPPTPPHHDCN